MVEIREIDEKTRLIPTWKEFKALPNILRWITYAIVVSILYMTINIVGYLMPFHPWIFYEYDVIPKTVCAGEEVTVLYTSETKRGLYTLSKVTGEAYWIEAETGRAGGDTLPVDHPLNYHEKKSFKSPVTRQAPGIPGEWIVASDLTAHGKMFGIVPVNDYQELRGKEPITVLPLSDPRCDYLLSEEAKD